MPFTPSTTTTQVFLFLFFFLSTLVSYLRNSIVLGSNVPVTENTCVFSTPFWARARAASLPFLVSPFCTNARPAPGAVSPPGHRFARAPSARWAKQKQKYCSMGSFYTHAHTRGSTYEGVTLHSAVVLVELLLELVRVDVAVAWPSRQCCEDQ